jgi:hypothetical protein
MHLIFWVITLDLGIDPDIAGDFRTSDEIKKELYNLTDIKGEFDYLLN